MAKPIKEIMITLFNNADGMTLSVTANHSDNGRRVNFSFKGNNTKSFKAINDGIPNMPGSMQSFFQGVKEDFRPLIENAKTSGVDVRFSKGYVSKNRSKGKTVKAAAALAYSGDYYYVTLNLGGNIYKTALDTSYPTPAQRENNAVAGHRWRESADDEFDEGDDFLGD